MNEGMDAGGEKGTLFSPRDLLWEREQSCVSGKIISVIGLSFSGEVFFLGGDEFPLEEAVPSMGSSCLFLVKFFLQYDSLSLFQRFSVEFLS